MHAACTALDRPDHSESRPVRFLSSLTSADGTTPGGTPGSLKTTLSVERCVGSKIQTERGERGQQEEEGEDKREWPRRGWREKKQENKSDTARRGTEKGKRRSAKRQEKESEEAREGVRRGKKRRKKSEESSEKVQGGANE
eukprot:133180-Pleurochrysis_carterae.AAC.4